jgi:hypothetical protein
MATLTIQDPGRAAAELDLTTSVASGGDQWLNTGREMLFIKNTDASGHTFSVTVQAQPDGKNVTERVISVGAGKTYVAGPYPRNEYNDAGGYAQITYSAATGMKVAVVRVAP